jgi:hypothetical protein
VINIVCVRWGEKFSKDYVNILYSGIRKHFEGEIRFICVSDDTGYDEGIEVVKLPEGLTGWWGKLWLFSEEFQKQLTGQCFFFDLDTIITGHLDEMFKYRGEFCILRDFYRYGGYGSGLMSWKPMFGTHIWESWVAAGKPEIEGGDQAWIEKVICDADLWQDIFPEWVVSYKVHAEQWPPSQSKVVCFHGFPKPHECNGGWVQMMWNKDGVSVPKFANNANTSTAVMLRQVEENCKRDLPWFQSQPEHTGSLVIVGGAPSLKENYRNIKDRQKRGQKVIALNGALNSLMENGIKPDFLVMMDARQENVKFVTEKHDVKYLINAACHADVFDALEGNDVTVWHSYVGDDEAYREILEQYPDKPWGIIGTGNTVGLTSIVLGFFMGYRKFHLYGMDSSYSEDTHHAYPQSLNDGESTFTVHANGKAYKCARWMMKQADDFQNIYKTLFAQGCTITAHGSGLLPDVCRYMNDTVRNIGEKHGILQNR